MYVKVKVVILCMPLLLRTGNVKVKVVILLPCYVMYRLAEFTSILVHKNMHRAMQKGESLLSYIISNMF